MTDLESLYQSMLDGVPLSIDRTVTALKELWLEEDWESVEIFAEDILTDETPKEFLSVVLQELLEMPEFVEDLVASIDGKRIVSEKDFFILYELKKSSRFGDSDEFNSSRSGRASIALNPETPTPILLKLASDSEWEIRYRVTLNPSSSTEVLGLALQGDYPDNSEFLDEYIEATIALHKNTSEAILMSLANSEKEVVRSAVACNPNSTVEVVDLAKSKGVNFSLINIPEFNMGTPGFRQTRLCWWDIHKPEWTLADLSNLHSKN